MSEATRKGPLLACSGLTKRFTEGRLDVTVLRGIDLQVQRGETVAIVGASGSGKSTLLHLLGGLDAPTSGSVTLCGQALAKLDAAAQGRLRNAHLGFVYQFHHLLPEFSALDNVAMPLTIRRDPPAQAQAVAMDMLRSVGLAERAAHRPAELSGGQRQRVAIARAVAIRPKLLLFDEPTSALDPEMTAEVLEVIADLKSEGRTFILVTHAMNFARTVADQVAFLANGKILEQAPAKDFFSAPTTDTAQRFLAKVLKY